MPAEDLSRLEEALAALDDHALRALVGDAPSRGSWAWSGAVELDGVPLFVKRIPVTGIEVDDWPSTRNHYGLPLAYQYGVGSAGFGAARELEAARTTTGWVDEGATDGFARLLHGRVVPLEGSGWSSPIDRDDYVALWGDDASIGHFVDGRVAAGHELWLVFEHLPHTLDTWLPEHLDRVDDVLATLLGSAALMRDRGMVHFDAHFANVVLDGAAARICLVDLGLAVTGQTELTGEERQFVDGHGHYDAAEIIANLARPLGHLYGRMDDATRVRVAAVCGAADGARPDLITHAPRLVDEGLMDLDPVYLAALERYGPVIRTFNGFLRALVEDPAKRTRHDDVAVAGLLREAGVAV